MNEPEKKESFLHTPAVHHTAVVLSNLTNAAAVMAAMDE